ILPHERTLSGPKVDRLKLMRATRAHFSQIFGLYPDPERRSDELFSAVESTEPAVDARTPDGVVQRLWRLVDRDAIRALAAPLEPRGGGPAARAAPGPGAPPPAAPPPAPPRGRRPARRAPAGRRARPPPPRPGGHQAPRRRVAGPNARRGRVHPRAPPAPQT